MGLSNSGYKGPFKRVRGLGFRLLRGSWDLGTRVKL